MAKEVVMPALGMAQETGRLLRWLKAEGESVSAGEPVMEVETDKAVVEVEATADGILHQVLAAHPERDVPVGEVVGYILAPGEAPAPKTAEDPAPRPPVPASPETAVSHGPGRAVREGRVPMSPKARRLARELGVTPESLAGLGRPVTAADIARRAAGKPSRRQAIERRMAERTAQAWREAPHFYLTAEVDAEALALWLDAGRASVPELTYTDLLVFALSRALVRHPELNATFSAAGKEGQAELGVGLAVATPEGLVVPVLRHPERLSLADIARARGELVRASREGALRPEDFAGGTITLTNLGMYRVDSFHPVLNLGQTAIVAVGRIARRPAEVAGALGLRRTLHLTVACDHRAVDGATAAAFLDTLCGILENPLRLLV
jgi:pyruvate dehydrogenase E2 component (dihydrolipoamide acetyltransferase)